MNRSHRIPTPRDNFIMALTGRQPPGQVPTFELVFFLTMELFGKVHPRHRFLNQWSQTSANEKKRQIADAGDVYIQTARHFGHSAIFVHFLRGVPDAEQMIAEYIREETGDEFFLLRHGDATLGIPDGESMTDFCCRLFDEPQQVKTECKQDVDEKLAYAERLVEHRLFDGFGLCTDYCFNSGPLLSPGKFGEFVAPYLAQLIQGYRDMGFYVIKHTDGDIMPIIDQLVQCQPHALHSLDPQAGVDIAQVKRMHGCDVCLIGNVNCGLLQTGTDEDAVESSLAALHAGMPGGGYIFSTSNCVYPGMPLQRYELMMDVWRREGVYPEVTAHGDPG